MKTIVVGVDGSPASLEALSWAGDVARRAGATLVAVRAGLPGKGTLSSALRAQLEDKVRHELEVWCKERELAVTPTPVLADKDPRIALPAVAAELGADLLVVGARGTSGLAGLFLGGVAQHLAQQPARPLAIVPARPVGDTRHAVVGVDGSAGSLAAVRFCVDLAGALDIPVTAVLAQEPFAELVPATDADSWQQQAQQDLSRWTEPLRAADVSVELVVDRDIHPVAALGRAVADRPGSLAVVGTRGQGGFAGLRLGRVPLQLLQRADVPVVIVPTPQA